jgi:hypothetical protein
VEEEEARRAAGRVMYRLAVEMPDFCGDPDLFQLEQPQGNSRPAETDDAGSSWGQTSYGGLIKTPAF